MSTPAHGPQAPKSNPNATPLPAAEFVQLLDDLARQLEILQWTSTTMREHLIATRSGDVLKLNDLPPDSAVLLGPKPLLDAHAAKRMRLAVAFIHGAVLELDRATGITGLRS